jgi:hypothetical protein
VTLCSPCLFLCLETTITMSTLNNQDFPTSLDAEACTGIFAYLIVVYVLVSLSLNELEPEARRSGGFPPSGWLYLTSVLLWPVTIGTFVGLMIMGLLHAVLCKPYVIGAQKLEACGRWIISYVPKARLVEDFEMRPLYPRG